MDKMTRQLMKMIFVFLTISMCVSAQTAISWKLIFEDNFEGTSFNTQNWSYCVRYGSDWNKYLVSSSQTVQVANGELIVKAIKNTNTAIDNVPYLTGGIQSSKKFNFTFGKVEVRAKMVSGKGAWPAIWLMPDIQAAWPTGGEIDMMERLNNDAFVYHTLHSHYTYNLGINNPVKSKTAAILPNDYNVYGLEWFPDRMDFYLNGKFTFSYPRIVTSQVGQWPFDHPFYLILNQAAGGSWVGSVTDADLPFQMQVDYVKVYQRDATQAYTVPSWSNTTYPYNSTHWKDEYVRNITSTGALNNVQYTATAHPAGYVEVYPDTLILTENTPFQLVMKANSLGAYNESTVLQDLRYTHCTAFADFDGDRNFETVLPTIGNTPPTNGVGGNFNVMDVTHTFQVPSGILSSGRIRIVYRNAWSNLISPDASLNEGMIYDFNIKVVAKSTDIHSVSSGIHLGKDGNRLSIKGLYEDCVVTLISSLGKVLSSNTIRDDQFALEIPRGLSILNVRFISGEIYTQKLINMN